MFTTKERETIAADILNAAKSDARITGGAITGSASVGKADQWSDIDFAFAVGEGNEVSTVLTDFSDHMYPQHGAIHHLDVASGTWIYRVFFLANTLQVDLAFAPEADFGARGPTFKLLFGEAKELPQPTPPDAETLIGWAWLYAIHARSCIARGKVWQAEYMISGMRDQVLSLACLRHNLPVREGRGLDQLPSDVTNPAADSLLRSLEREELLRAFRVVTNLLVAEIAAVDAALASKLAPALVSLEI
jgi:hypothetical protein